MIKILGGSARGVSLILPEATYTRPTLSLLKRRLFDFRQNYSGIHFLDLCAGSGSIGLEAWSRGASSVVLVESNKRSAQVIEKNIERVTKGNKEDRNLRPIKLLGIEAISWLSKFLASRNSGEDGSFVIYFDPPYSEEELYLRLLTLLKEHEFRGEAWIEYSDKFDSLVGSHQLNAPVPYKTFNQSESFLYLLDYSRD